MPPFIFTRFVKPHRSVTSFIITLYNIQRAQHGAGWDLIFFQQHNQIDSQFDIVRGIFQ